MGRGILTGLVWGVVVGFGVIAIANEVVEPVTITYDPPAAAGDLGVTQSALPGETPAPDLEPEGAAGEPDRSGAQPDVATTVAPRDAAPVPQDIEAAPKPQITTREGAPVAPQDGTAPQTQTATTDTPTLTAPQGLAPQTATGDALPQVELALPDRAPQPLLDTQTRVAPQPPLEGSAPTDPAPLEDAQPEEGVSELETPDAGDAQSAMPGVVKDEPAPTEPAEKPAFGERVTAFTDRTDARKSARLPTIGGNASLAAPEPAASASVPAYIANAASVDAPRPGPLLSIVLIDTGDIAPDDGMIAALPFAVTIGVDALDAQAPDRGDAFIAQGHEVLALVGLPDGASPQDVAVTLGEVRHVMPHAIGFLDTPAASYQSRRQIAAQVVATAQESGHALLTYQRGLDSLEQEAMRAKTPAALVFRDIDGRGQDTDAIKRFLDQAAFRAGVDGEIILVARTKPDTLKAITEWALGTRAASVSMVPFSTLLIARDGDQTTDGFDKP
ncbi:divergent polysaccharide deacetylase family protein [Celeribacter arenosi]|uniref:Divergent polysaccharide deacetylase n=1 Tax=Celeribacter arenosi TaxID=792649 RepID=A0ABP7KBS3_9RHOB